jgi:hypothetical protein
MGAMRLKPAILSVLNRDDLKHMVDDLEINGVDRRSVDGMRSALSRARRAKPEDLLGYLREDQIQEVCGVVGVSPKGKRDELIDRLVNGTEPKPKQRRGSGMSTKKQTELDFNGELKQAAARQKKAEKLTLACLERRLFEACDMRPPWLRNDAGMYVSFGAGGPRSGSTRMCLRRSLRLQQVQWHPTHQRR